MTLGLKRAILALILLAVSSAAVNASQAVVTVNGRTITDEDLNAAIIARVGDSYSSDQNKQQIRTIVLKQLISEIIAETLVGENEIRADSRLQKELSESRRAILLRYFLKKQLPRAEEPSAAEINQYISAHPEYFEDRRMFHFAELTVRTTSSQQLMAVEARLKQFQETKTPDSERLQVLMTELLAAHIVYGYNIAWEPSERLPTAILRTLTQLEQSGAKIALEKNGLSFRAVVLFGSFADPLKGLLVKQKVYQEIMNAKQTPALAALSNQIFSKAKIKIYDKSISDAFLPKASEAPAPASRSPFEWALASIVLFVFLYSPVALYRFYANAFPEAGAIPVNAFDHAIARLNHWSYTRTGRSVILVCLAILLIAPAPALLRELFSERGRFFLGGCLGAASLATIAVYFLLKRADAGRWSPILTLAVVYFVVMTQRISAQVI